MEKPGIVIGRCIANRTRTKDQAVVLQQAGHAWKHSSKYVNPPLGRWCRTASRCQYLLRVKRSARSNGVWRRRWRRRSFNLLPAAQTALAGRRTGTDGRMPRGRGPGPLRQLRILARAGLSRGHEFRAPIPVRSEVGASPHRRNERTVGCFAPPCL